MGIIYMYVIDVCNGCVCFLRLFDVHLGIVSIYLSIYLSICIYAGLCINVYMYFIPVFACC
jgi:hypothetical protein